RAQELAQIFAPVSPTTTKEWIEQTLGESQDEDTVLLTLRQEDFRKIQEQLRTFEGISTVEQGRLLSVSKTLNSPLDAELNKYWE
ncbi:penicillin-binding protein, partial [Corynebacterium amycolatum]